MSADSATVLVTGATGFVGSHVVEALLDAGHIVRCTVRRTSDTRWLDGLDVERVEADMRRREALEEAVRGAASVVHLAGVTRASRPDLYRRVNGDGTARLGEAAVEAGVGRFVYVSSLAARGPDGAEGPVSEYGASKREGEERLRGMRDRVEVVVLRPGGVYGPRDEDLLPLFRAAARGWLVAPSGGSVLQPVYASDVARAVLSALEGDAGFGPFPLAEEGVYDWPAIGDAMAAAFGHAVRLVRLPAGAFEGVGVVAQTLWRLAGRAPPLDRRRARDVARHRWTCDPGPSERALGWRAGVALPEGLRRSVEWYREAGWL
ncbi:MAG: NAD-dependent epimerase/dehydratase family protein [Candidatus Palauibacterales bacterium]|nr:NAD-dependent epimerase/dehydratase family protein [Candidatus Palauibacterales bacterium]MDP2531021.1 NAD-dependent epimerase/dehydratase family protein [Candidatus Palauibacterales bacterium]MDP2583464.1 NAD-dependent epimerase/dehydratase family protein [Candidatus Palauibacterales bacterium]